MSHTPLSSPSSAPSTSRPAPSPDVVRALETALDSCPEPGAAPSPNPWHALLYDCLKDEALPVLICNEATTPSASLWTGARLWVDTFRTTDLQPGDRLVLALPPTAAFVQVLVAALWEGYTIAFARPDEDVAPLLSTLDARAAVTTESESHAWTAHEQAGPKASPDTLRAPTTQRTPDVRFLLRTSGTTALATWVALSDRNVLSVLASHLPHFSLRNARVLSVLPWTHAFGLVLDLLPALFAGAEIVRDPNGGRDPTHLTALHKEWGVTHLSAVPLTIRELINTPGGPQLLSDLDGGIVGGAPVAGPLAMELNETSLRAGYGQTEAAPGIALGAPGDWAAHYLGRSVGCSVEVSPEGELFFEGPNACVGLWENGALNRLDPNRTVATGDLVRRDGPDLYYEGRKDASFTLSNGRLVRAGALEGILKMTHPALHDALVFTPNGNDVAVAVCPARGTDERPSHETLKETLGTLGKRLVWSPTIPRDEWHTGPKGTVDRTRMTEILSNVFAK